MATEEDSRSETAKEAEYYVLLNEEYPKSEENKENE